MPVGAKTILPSNRFGRIEQKIVFLISAGNQDNLPGDLDIILLEETISPPRSFYLWRRWSLRRADDEDIVVELSGALGFNQADWQIDWALSIY